MRVLVYAIVGVFLTAGLLVVTAIGQPPQPTAEQRQACAMATVSADRETLARRFCDHEGR